MNTLCLYKKSLDDFSNNINDNYKEKKNIIKFLDKLFEKMLYSAPEILCNVFYRESFKLQLLLPEPTEWSINAWNNLCSNHNKIVENMTRNKK